MQSQSFNVFFTSKLFRLYTRHHNPLLIINHCWIVTVHKIMILPKNLLEKMFLTFKNELCIKYTNRGL